MPCMCGDSCCPSCGPAQGNWRCPICREWASEGCQHIEEIVAPDHSGATPGGILRVKPEFEQQAKEIEAQENAYWEQYNQEHEKEELTVEIIDWDDLPPDKE